MDIGIALISCTVIVCVTYYLSLLTKRGMDLAKHNQGKNEK